MLYLVYSATNKDTLSRNLGAPEYSYFFVREYFEWMLERFGARAVQIFDPETEAERYFGEARSRGEPCLLLSFAPPHRSFVGIKCPTVPVFAWEFDTLPNEAWNDDARYDWRTVLSEFGAAITHSHYSLDAIKRAMGADFPVLAVPAPVFDRIYDNIARRSSAGELTISGPVLDSRRPESWMLAETAPAETELAAEIATVAGPVHQTPAPTDPIQQASDTEELVPPRKSLKHRVELTAFYLVSWYRDAVRDLLPRPAQRFLASSARGLGRLLRPLRHVPTPVPPAEVAVPETANEETIIEAKEEPAEAKAEAREVRHFHLDGVVYTAVFNPRDGRKNWEDILLAFCVAHAEREDATLILKFASSDPEFAYEMVRDNLRKLPPFRCRVIALSVFFDEQTYCQLIASSTYVVNASRSEGQCLPVMEFMSAGKPAIAPRNTAFGDYIDENIAFIVNDSKELCCWPHDGRNMYRAHRYRIDWESLVDAFDASYRVAKERPEQYRKMSGDALARMRGFCSQDAVWKKFSAFVNLITGGQRSELTHAHAVAQRPAAASRAAAPSR